MDSKILGRVNEEMAFLKDLHVDVHSVTVIKDGYIVAEQFYSDEYNTESTHPIASITKSVMSAAFGIAKEEGYISSLDQNILEFFPEYEIENMSEEKANINLRQMLTMSAGFDWHEFEYSYDDPRSNWNDWIESPDRVKYLLDLPLETVPGESYNYNATIYKILCNVNTIICCCKMKVTFSKFCLVL